MSVMTVMENLSETVKHSEHIENMGFLQDHENEDNAREAELVVFDGTTQGLGLKVCGGSSVDGKQGDGIFIKRILPGGLAEVQGGLEEGDLILDVNGQSMEGITYDRALSILRQASASDHVEIVISRDEEAREAFLKCLSSYTPADQTEPGKISPFPVKPLVNGEHAMAADTLEEFQSHVAEFYKQTASLRSDLSFDVKGDEKIFERKTFTEENTDQHLLEEKNSRLHSPASVCDSEVAEHIPTLSADSEDCHGDSVPLQFGNMSSLHTVLSHSFPLSGDMVSPSCRFPVTKLESTLQSLGFMISTEKHIELLKNISIDSQGLASFDNFVRAAKQVFSEELEAKSSSHRSSPLLSSESPAHLSPLQNSFHWNGFSDDVSLLQQENEMLRKQIESLKEEVEEQKHLCQKAEEQVLSLRKESQTAMEESRSLRTKLRLSEQSLEVAHKMEQDYEQVVAMLENEISHLRLQMSKSDGLNEHKRLAVAACQLKKSETVKKTYEVATNKLLSHLQHVQDVLAGETSLSSRFGVIDKGEKKKKHKVAQMLFSENLEVIRAVQKLIEQVPLPFGWEENYTADGVRYYINHLNQTTSWTHPSSNVEHQSITMAAGSSTAKTQSSVDTGKRSDNTAPVGV